MAWSKASAGPRKPWSFLSFWHLMLAGWDTDEGQRIGSALEIEGVAGAIDPGALTECSDGLDNDGDGATDFPGDAGCTDANDGDESNCGDGVCEGGETSASCAANVDADAELGRARAGSLVLGSALR